MQDKEEFVRDLSNHYTIRVIRAFGNGYIEQASKSLEIIAKSLNDIYRYFEPSFFKGDFFVCKNLHDEPCYESDGIPLYDKNILLNKTDGMIIIQVFNDSGKMIIWGNQNPDEILGQKETLTYHFKDNKEYFFANSSKIDITKFDKGSRFATQFNDLVNALQCYSQTKVLKSACRHFSQSWSDPHRIFLRGGGRGSNIPEKFMQLSLHEFLSIFLVRGISIECLREQTVMGDSDKPKPVDIKIQWREANRTALIEIKFLGTVKTENGGIYTHGNSRANEGITQLKGYHDKANTDSPTTIIKSFLVVIDGRRKNVTADQTTINNENGMYYRNTEIVIDDDKKYHETIMGFEKLIRMFAEPICSVLI